MGGSSDGGSSTSSDDGPLFGEGAAACPIEVLGVFCGRAEFSLAQFEPPIAVVQQLAGNAMLPMHNRGAGISATGLLLWNSGVVLAEWLRCSGKALRGRSVLELGAGLGVAGLAAAQAGARVHMTDIEPALTELCAQVERNGSPEGVTLSSLCWTEGPAAARAEVARALEGVRVGPERGRPSMPAFDLVVGADLIYSTAAHSALAHTLGALLVPERQLPERQLPSAAAAAPAWARRAWVVYEARGSEGAFFDLLAGA